MSARPASGWDWFGSEASAEVGKLIGYAWAPLQAAVGCRKIFADDGEDAQLRRPGLRRLLDDARPGDVIVVWSLDCLCWSVAGLALLASRLKSRNLEFVSLREVLDTTSPGGWMIFHVFAALADFSGDVSVGRLKEVGFTFSSRWAPRCDAGDKASWPLKDLTRSRLTSQGVRDDGASDGRSRDE